MTSVALKNMVFWLLHAFKGAATAQRKGLLFPDPILLYNKNAHTLTFVCIHIHTLVLTSIAVLHTLLILIKFAILTTIILH